ncbi:MAG: tetratricopeptide repeat protein [Flavobacteriales bacterium]|nr:tetratricopeptide repeat protein [Flavobacteriales bacterium]
MEKKKHRSFGKWRTATLIGVHVLFIAHFVHWKIKGRTLAPLEFNEVMYTLHQGIVTAGFILMALVMLATVFFGRFFCSWGCHILALQDSCGWLMDKLHIRRQPIRSRTLIWIPMAVMFYLFIWPQVLALFHGLDGPQLEVVQAGGARWSSFTTDNFWRNLPPPGVAVFTFFICGFAIVYLLGSRGFCFQACPYGALFGIADQLAPGRIVLAGDCTQCGLCTKACTSDILVHRELATHGMVTNPRCLKDLDCIAVCPEEAVQYGFRKPPLFRKGQPMGSYSGRFSFTLKEDLFMLAAFVISVFIFRGLYDAVPFLLAVGLAVCTAYILHMGIQLIRSGTMQLRGIRIKVTGHLRPAGWVFGAFTVAVLVLLVHSGIVQWHTWKGRSVFTELSGTTAGVPAEQLGEGIEHYEKALAIGMIRPIDRRKELANLYLLAGERAKSIELLKGIVAQDPGHVEARYRLGELADAAGDHRGAIAHWERTLQEGLVRPHSRDEELLGLAALALADERARKGEVRQARLLYEQASTRTPNDPRPLLSWAALEAASGADRKAIALLEQALQRGADEVLVRNNIGGLLLRGGQWNEALVQYRRLAELRPGDAQIRYTLGVTQARTGDPVAAQESLTKALTLDPSHTNAKKALDLLALQHRTDPAPTGPGS